jgi:hypothetical protein
MIRHLTPGRAPPGLSGAGHSLRPIGHLTNRHAARYTRYQKGTQGRGKGMQDEEDSYVGQCGGGARVSGGRASDRAGALAAARRGTHEPPDGTRLRGLRSERLNPQRIVNLVLIFSDVVLALAVWGVAIVVRATWGTSTIAGVLPTNTIAGVLPVAV